MSTLRPSLRDALTALRWWTPRRWAAAALASIGVALLIGIPTAVIPNPVFGRSVDVTSWSYPVLALSAVAGGMLLATYLRPDTAGQAAPTGTAARRAAGVDGGSTQNDENGSPQATPVRATTVVAVQDGDDVAGGQEEPWDGSTRSMALGGVLAYLAVGCPVCNKLVLVALGSSGAMTWFAPLQPILAGLGVVVMVWALLIRLAGEVSCPTPTR